MEAVQTSILEESVAIKKGKKMSKKLQN
jgi:hypothetical protein